MYELPWFLDMQWDSGDGVPGFGEWGWHGSMAVAPAWGVFFRNSV
jgi:hypothetical protein